MSSRAQGGGRFEKRKKRNLYPELTSCAGTERSLGKRPQIWAKGLECHAPRDLDLTQHILYFHLLVLLWLPMRGSCLWGLFVVTFAGLEGPGLDWEGCELSSLGIGGRGDSSTEVGLCGKRVVGEKSLGVTLVVSFPRGPCDV